MSGKIAFIDKFKTRHRVVPAVYIVFLQESSHKILLLRRANTGYHDSEYSLPAGHLDGNESAIQAAIREAKEEVGVEIKPQDLQFLHVMHRLSEVPIKHERIDLYFKTTKWQGKPFNAEPQKHSELRWADINNPPNNVIPEVKQALAMIISGKTYSDTGFKLVEY